MENRNVFPNKFLFSILVSYPLKDKIIIHFSIFDVRFSVNSGRGRSSWSYIFVSGTSKATQIIENMIILF